ncbi:MAG: hypothetical protein ACE5J2_05790 [Nitrososphaerales archaeon]
MLLLLAVFVFSIFWRGAVPSLLSLAGSGSIYGGILYVYAKVKGLALQYDYTYNLPQVMPDRLAIMTEGDASLLTGHVATVSAFYFIIGFSAMILSLVIALKPSVFYAKGSRTGLAYPIWSNAADPKSVYGPNILRMIPVMALLTSAERYLVAKYRYIQVVIGGTMYFASPADWVPEGSIVMRDKESGSLLGIPKLLDGF